MDEYEFYEDEYEPNWQPIPGKPGWKYDANLGEWREGMAMRTGIPASQWGALYAAPLQEVTI